MTSALANKCIYTWKVIRISRKLTKLFRNGVYGEGVQFHHINFSSADLQGGKDILASSAANYAGSWPNPKFVRNGGDIVKKLSWKRPGGFKDQVQHGLMNYAL